MHAVVAQLCALADRHPDSTQIAADAAWGVQRLLNVEMYDLHEARRLVGVLGDLAERRYSDGVDQCEDPGLAVAGPCSEGLANFTTFPDVTADEVHTVVTQLRELSGRHPNASKPAAMVAVGLFQLALLGGLTNTGIRKAIGELGRIAGLDHGESSAPYRIAQQLHALSMKDSVDTGGARAAVAELGRLLDRDPPVVDIVTRWEIARLYASGLHGLMNRADATQKDVRKARLELGRLSLTHGGDPEIDKYVSLMDLEPRWAL